MKILTGIDIPFNPFGGSPIICDDWYSRISQKHEVLFVAMPPSTHEKWWQIENVQFLKTKKSYDINRYQNYISDLIDEITEIFNSFRPEIIHVQHLNFGLSRAFVSIAPHIPKIGICHGTDTQVATQNDFFKQNLLEITDKVDFLIFPAKNMATDFFTIYEKEKEYVICPHGIPDFYFENHSIHSNEKTLRLIYAGRLNTYKGVEIAVLSMQYIHTCATLDVFGEEDETGFRKKLEILVAEKSLGHRITFHHQVSRVELMNLYSQYDAILIPSTSLEAFSLTSIEAQARGVPVIYGNGGGITDVVGESGYLIEDNNPQTLAKIIDELNIDREKLNLLRKKGYVNANRYRLSRQTDEILRFSQHLIEKSRGHEYGKFKK
jgi:glycosyltransferase involved in cell wall biosynthesis